MITSRKELRSLCKKRTKLVQAVSLVPKVSSNPTECVAIVYLLQIARENDVCKCGRELVGYARWHLLSQQKPIRSEENSICTVLYTEPLVDRFLDAA